MPMVVNGGFAEVGPTGLTVLADMAVPRDDFDVAMLAGTIKDTEEDVTDDDRRLEARQARPQARAAQGAAGGAPVGRGELV